MAYGTLMRRAWQLVWSHKFLIVIAAIPQVIALVGYTLNSVTGVLGSFLIIAGGVLSQASLLTGIHQIIETGQSGYQRAWDVVWPKKWRLAGIEILAALPAGLLGGAIGGVLGAVWVFAIAIAFAELQVDPSLMTAGLGVGAGVTMFLCGLLVMINIPFAVWGRGAVITSLRENTGVTESLGWAWDVIRSNLREGVTLALIQIAVSLCLNLILALPLLVVFLCPLAWPVSWFVTASLSAWWAAVWTMAWVEWAPAATKIQPVRT